MCKRVLHHAADLRSDFPELADLREIFDQQGDRQPALHFELAVEARFGLLEHLGRKIGGEQLDPPSGDSRSHLLEAHCQRIGLLPGRRRRAPDPDLPLRRPGGEQRRHDGRGTARRYSEEKGLVVVVIASTTSTTNASGQLLCGPPVEDPISSARRGTVANGRNVTLGGTAGAASTARSAGRAPDTVAATARN